MLRCKIYPIISPNSLMLLIALMLLEVLASVASAQESTEDDALLIEWSAVEPRVEYIANEQHQLQDLPFNGTVTVFVADDGTELVWNLWSERSFKLEEFGRNRAALELLAERPDTFKLFARFNMPTTSYDWLDDQRWAHILNNIRLFGALCKLGRFDGIILDTEQYGEQIFAYADSQYEQAESIRDAVKRRGSDWIAAIHESLPQPTIMLTFGYNAAKPMVGDGRPGYDYRLLEPFLDGILESAADNTRIVDGWEYSYGFQDEEKFQSARAEFDRLETQGLYRYRMELGFGLWLDHAPNKHLWNDQDPSQNYFTPEGFATAVRYARKHGDGVVWIYSKRPNWWTGVQMHPNYVKALRDITTEAKP